jgi:hypothetical protein
VFFLTQKLLPLMVDGGAHREHLRRVWRAFLIPIQRLRFDEGRR